MISVLEPALTVSPGLMATDTTVPLIGLVRVASLSDCCASVRLACAVSMAAWSDAICSDVSVFPEVPPLPLLDGPVDPLPPVGEPLEPVFPVNAASLATAWDAGPELPVAPPAFVPPDDSAASAWAKA